MNYKEVAMIFINRFPEFKADMDSHIKEFDDILIYVFFPQVFCDYIKPMLKADIDKQKLCKLFDFFEEMAQSQDQATRDLLSLTILDNLRDDPAILEMGKLYCRENTTELLGNILRNYGQGNN